MYAWKGVWVWRPKRYRPAKYFFPKKWSYWLYRSLKCQRLTKIPLKKKKKLSLDNFSVFFGPWNYVSKTLRGTGCIAPKLRRAQVEGSKTLWGTGWGVQNSAGQICLQYLTQSFGPLNLCPVDFWTLQPVPRGVLEQCNLCPRSFGDIVSGTNIISKIIQD